MNAPYDNPEETIAAERTERETDRKCPQCGAVSIYDALETAAVCPFCGSTNVMPAATDDTIAPAAVCPFAITKEQAGECFKKWLSHKWFAPRKAKRTASPEAFNGVYLPYWTYDAETTSDFTARAGYDSTERDDDGRRHTTTDWKRVNGLYQEFFDDVTVVASKRHKDSGVTDCEPFDFSKLVPYTPQVVAGFVAERYSIGLKEGWEMAQQTIHSRLNDHIAKHVKKRWHADRADRVKFSTLYKNITYKYLLVPAWISSFKYKDKVYQFAVNGQTGKVGGKTPISAFRVFLFTLFIIAISVLLFYINE